MKQHAKRASWARVLLVPTLLLGSASMAAFPVHAAQVELNQTVTLQMRKVKLADVFKKLSNLSGYEFFYDESVVQKYNMIDIDLDNVSFDQALEQIRKQTSLQLSKVNNTIVVSLARQVLASSGKVQASRHRVTGRVTDANNEPLIGVSIVIQGNSGGTITDIDGRYTLEEVDADATLVFSYIGYVPQKIVVGNQQILNVQMKEDNQTLEEVVVIGYGVQKKRDMTGSIASIKSKDITAIPTTNALEALQGKVAGLDLTNSSGQAGSTPNFTIRGERSLTASNAPLILVDGIDYGTSLDINPTDIESIEVLKDASSTAIYGSRGANGVIQVTTKRATTGTSQIDLSAKFGVSQLQKGNLEMMSGAEYYDYVRTAYENTGTLDSQAWLQPYLRERNFDWWDLATQNALTQNYNIGYRYGNDKIKSYVSGDYYSEEGTIKGFDYDRFTFRSNTDYIVNDRLTLKAKVAASYKETFNQEYYLMHTSYTPWDTPWDSQGNLKDGTQGVPTADAAPTANPDDYWYSDGGSNFLYDHDLNWSKSRNNGIDLGVGFDFKIIEGLTFESNNRIGFTNNYSSSNVDPKSRGAAGDGGSY